MNPRHLATAALIVAAIPFAAVASSHAGPAARPAAPARPGAVVAPPATPPPAPSVAVPATPTPTAARTWTCTEAPGGAAMAATAVCDYGAPARSGEHLLVPRVCRVPVQDKLYDRHGVDIRHGTTGARIGQASLPPLLAKPGSPLPVVGSVLGGADPLLVFAAGIAAIDPRAGRAEAVFEAETGLVAVARRNEVLAVVERLAPGGAFPRGGLEWTVLDYGAGVVLGQLQLAGTALDSLGVRGKTGLGLEAFLTRTDQGKAIEIVAEVLDAQGKPVAKDDVLTAKVRPVATTAVPARGSPSATSCPSTPPALAILVGAGGLVVSADPARQRATPPTTEQAQAGAGCLGVFEVNEKGHGFAWFAPDAGRRELRPVVCR